MDHDTLTAEQFEDFREVIATHLGIRMPPTKRVMLQSRLHRRVRELGLRSFGDYHGHFFTDPSRQAAELEHLLNLATTNKTDFFREPGHFEVLARETVPAWLARPAGPVFHVWCAGCATGEEAYTIAMTLLECRARHPFEFAIRATDVSTRALEAAMQATYTEEHAKPIPPALRAKYMLRSRDRQAGLVRVGREARARVKFGHLNFLAPDYGLPEMADAVFFRNVMIYFDRPTQQQVVARICRHLRPGGDLFISHSETLQGLDLPLRLAGPARYQREPDGNAP
jgi:chemotaxis protein methyltransferase CheR